MYGLVPYNLSPIQQGIQFGHAVVEYGLLYGQENAWQQWANEDKTFIILNGGTTNDKISEKTGLFVGSLNNHEVTLVENFGVDIARFTEPDLGDQLTAVVFLVDDYIWDEETFPEPEDKGFHEKGWWSELSVGELLWIFNFRDFLKGFRLA